MAKSGRERSDESHVGRAIVVRSSLEIKVRSNVPSYAVDGGGATYTVALARWATLRRKRYDPRQ